MTAGVPQQLDEVAFHLFSFMHFFTEKFIVLLIGHLVVDLKIFREVQIPLDGLTGEGSNALGL